MDHLIVGIGQAGVQIASELTSAILDSQIEDFTNTQNSLGKCFLLDSESKVIEKNLKNSKLKKHISLGVNAFKNSSGRGNNWALGYSLEYKEFRAEKNMNIEAYEKLISFVEKCDFLKGFLFIHSLNGGTGSGMSTRMIEKIRDDYPKFSIIDCPVAGFEIEKTTLSQLNNFFAFGHVYDKVNYIFQIQNEKFRKVSCDNFRNMNKTISEILLDYLLFREELVLENAYEWIKFIDIFKSTRNYIIDSHMSLNESLNFNKGSSVLSLDIICKANTFIPDYSSQLNKQIAAYSAPLISKYHVTQDKSLKCNIISLTSFTKLHSKRDVLYQLTLNIQELLQAK